MNDRPQPPPPGQLQLPEDAPIASEGALFDYLSRHFGIGDYDDLASEQPFWQWRAREVAKVKRSRTARGVALAELFIAAEFCRAHLIDVRNVVWLYPRLPAAKAWWRKRQDEAAAAAFESAYEAAVGAAAGEPDGVWLGRLVRAQGPSRADVLAAWSQARR